MNTEKLPLDLYVTRRGSFALVTRLPTAVLASFVVERYGWMPVEYELSPEVSSLTDDRFVTIGEPKRTFVSVVSVTELVPEHGAYYRLDSTEEELISASTGLIAKQRIRLKDLTAERVTLETARYHRSKVRSPLDMQRLLRTIPKKHRGLLMGYFVRQATRLKKDTNADTTGFIFCTLALAERVGLKEAYLA